MSGESGDSVILNQLGHHQSRRLTASRSQTKHVVNLTFEKCEMVARLAEQLVVTSEDLM